jgi:hypothetical protein
MDKVTDFGDIADLLANHYRTVEMEPGFRDALLERTRQIAAANRGESCHGNRALSSRITWLLRRRWPDRQSP